MGLCLKSFARLHDNLLSFVPLVTCLMLVCISKLKDKNERKDGSYIRPRFSAFVRPHRFSACKCSVQTMRYITDTVRG